MESDRAFKLLEECAISDEALNVRIAAITELIPAYPHKSVTAVKWLVQKDDNVFVLNAIREALSRSEDPVHEEISRTLRSRLASFYGVAEEEALLILECQSFIPNDVSRYYEKLHKFRFKVDPFSKRVIGIYMGNIELLDVPDVITHFPFLEELELSENYFTEIPDIWDKFPRLKTLYLDSNFLLESIPDSLFELSKKNFAAKYEREGVCPSEAPVLGLLEMLCGVKLKRYVDVSKIILKSLNPEDYIVTDLNELGGARIFREIVSKTPYIFYSVNRKGIVQMIFDDDSDYQFYKRDDEGHITGINLLVFGKGHFLSMLPEQIGLLSRLKELRAGAQYLRRIPTSICNLHELETLDLTLSCVESVPEGVKQLKNLKYSNIDTSDCWIVNEARKKAIEVRKRPKS